MAGTFWAFVPAIVAIVLALLTKQVYLSLFLGIFVGGMLFAGGNPLTALFDIFYTMADRLGANGGILVFLVVLGIFSVLLIRTGGSQAYGDWAAGKIKSRTGAMLSTTALGVVIFVDDYFNCLTVGSVMRPVTDKFKVSRAKLAYLIDSTAAPICIIAPISSWAAAVSGYVGDNGIVTFIQTVPFNVYALVTIVMMVTWTLLKLDVFGMAKRERAARKKNDVFAGVTDDIPISEVLPREDKKGKVWMLIAPIIILIVCCVGCMSFSGFFYDWDNGVMTTVPQSSGFVESISNCDSGVALATGSVIALIITIIMLVVGKAISFKDSMNAISSGFKQMVPAILILTFAWTLSAVMGAKGGMLDAAAYVEANVNAESMGMGVIPAVMFLIACGISFATGTSWGTFGILLPISLAVVGTDPTPLAFLTMAAVLAGAVYGDHVSPISDTTIMASSGAQCNHLEHVKTQLPYASIVAVICFITYLAAGFIAQTDISYGGLAGITLALGFGMFALVTSSFILVKKFGGPKLQKLVFDAGKGEMMEDEAILAEEKSEDSASQIIADSSASDFAKASVVGNEQATNVADSTKIDNVEESANSSVSDCVKAALETSDQTMEETLKK